MGSFAEFECFCNPYRRVHHQPLQPRVPDRVGSSSNCGKPHLAMRYMAHSAFHVSKGEVNHHDKITAGPKLDPRADSIKKGISAESRNPFRFCNGAEGGI